MTGIDLYPASLKWRLWSWMFAILLILVRVEMLWTDIGMIVGATTLSEQLLYIALEITEFAMVLDWFCALVLYRTCPSVKVSVWPTGWMCILAFFIEAVGLLATMFTGLDVPMPKLQYSLYVVVNFQLVLVHWTCAVLMSQECAVLRYELASSGTVEQYQNVERMVSEVQARWRLMIWSHAIPKIAALILLVIGEIFGLAHLSTSSKGIIPAAIDTGSVLVFLACFYLALLKPIHAYNDAVHELQLSPISFRTFQHLQRRPLFLYVAGIPVGSRFFKRVAAGTVTACVGVAVKAFLLSEAGV